MIGRRQHKSNQAFGQWCRENGFGDMNRRVRADAMWLAESWDEVWSVVQSLDNNHPTAIHRAYREALKANANPFTEADAEHVHKLNAMATRGATENEREVSVIERGGDPWFVASVSEANFADVCKALEIRAPERAYARLDEDERSTMRIAHGTSGGNPNVTIIP